MISKLLRHIRGKQQEIALEAVVKRQTHSEHGPLYDMYHDLAKYAEIADPTSRDPNDKLLLMTYAYARRSSAAGLYLQGHMEFQSWSYTKEIFKGFQATTGHTKVFQEKATELSVQFMLAYSPYWTRKNITALLFLAEAIDTPPFELGIIISYNNLIEMIEKVDTSGIS